LSISAICARTSAATIRTRPISPRDASVNIAFWMCVVGPLSVAAVGGLEHPSWKPLNQSDIVCVRDWIACAKEILTDSGRSRISDIAESCGPK
jgi:hypothetical protein